MSIGRVDPMRRFAVQQGGFTLLEVLVTMVILAIGLLGLAGLQATSLRFNQSSYLRSQATNLAYDMVDRMRANRNAALPSSGTGAYDNQALASPPPACAPGTALSGTVAAKDITAWRNALACTLPRGTGSIARNGANFTIIVQWDDTRGQSAPQQFSMMTEL